MVKIRLKRLGSKRNPIYRVIVIDGREKREGRPIEELGYYNPRQKDLKLNKEKALEWISKGAKATDTVNYLIKNCSDEGTLIKKEKPEEKKLSKKAQAKLEAEEAAKKEAKAKAKEEAEAKAKEEAEAAAKAEEEVKAEAEAPAEEVKAEAEEAPAEETKEEEAAEEAKTEA